MGLCLLFDVRVARVLFLAKKSTAEREKRRGYCRGAVDRIFESVLSVFVLISIVVSCTIGVATSTTGTVDFDGGRKVERLTLCFGSSRED